jgi:hypothetical protein
MALRARIGFTFVAAALILLIWFVAPAVTNESWPAFFNDIVNEYNEAAERASSHGDDDDDEQEEGGSAQLMTVILDDDAIDYAGVSTLPLSESLYSPEQSAYASVVDIRPLVQWRSRINQLQSAVNVAQVKEQSSRKELERLRKLAKSTGSVASKNVLYADASWQEAKANLRAKQFELEDAKAELVQSWGATIAEWVQSDESETFAHLVSHEEALLMVTLTVDATLAEDVSEIYVSRDGDRAHAVIANYVSPAYTPSQQIQGETYFFRLKNENLRVGMRLEAWIPQNEAALRGYQIPERAVVWYAGQPWAYVQQDEATYKRRPLVTGTDVSGGIFVESGFVTGELLVVSGSQMLLSEEFRWQIHDEDDD